MGSQSSGAVWKSRWPSWAPFPNRPTVSVDVKQHSTKIMGSGSNEARPRGHYIFHKADVALSHMAVLFSRDANCFVSQGFSHVLQPSLYRNICHVLQLYHVVCGVPKAMSRSAAVSRRLTCFESCVTFVIFQKHVCLVLNVVSQRLSCSESCSPTFFVFLM